MLGAEDARVREALASTFVQLTARLFFAEDWPGLLGRSMVNRTMKTYSLTL